MKVFFRCVALLVMIGGLWCGSGLFSPVHATSCSFSVTNVAFGSVNVTANAAVDTNATLSVTCSGLALTTVQVCVNFGAGSGGATNASDRFMLSGANKLHYSLYSDPGRTTVWGSDLWAGAGAGSVSINVPLLLGTNTVTQTVYGRVFSGQQTVLAGSYLSTFNSTDAEIVYGAVGLGCGLLSLTATTTFNVTATVPTTCTVATNNLNFGTAGLLSANTDASTTLSPECTNGTPYNVGLDGGLSGATDPTQRKMTLGAQSVLYGLYRDSARSLPFGNTIGSNTLTGTGTGLAQSISVYGRIPPQTTPSPGTYNDIIVVTLTY
jgi:spore coat protein U-like protein